MKTILEQKLNNSFPVNLFLPIFCDFYTLTYSDKYWLNDLYKCNVLLNNEKPLNLELYIDKTITWGFVNQWTRGMFVLNMLNESFKKFLDNFSPEELSGTDVQPFVDKFISTPQFKKIKRVTRDLDIACESCVGSSNNYDADCCRPPTYSDVCVGYDQSGCVIS